jgi:P27 family predicted phage terminase small subunit
MVTGRKPKPTGLKIVTGQNRADRMPKNEPKPVMVMADIPQPPSHLDAYALQEWNHICGALFRCGIMTEVDGRGLAMYCQAYGRWRKAEEAIQDMARTDPVGGGLIMFTTNGNVIQNPMVGTANTAMRDAMKYAAEYGLTPSSRVRLGIIADKAQDNDPTVQYFT